MTDAKILKERLKQKKRFIITQLHDIEEIVAEIREVVEASDRLSEVPTLR